MNNLIPENQKIVDEHGNGWYGAEKFALMIQQATAAKCAEIGDALNADILKVIEDLMDATGGVELELLGKLSEAVECYEKARYPELSGALPKE